MTLSTSELRELAECASAAAVEAGRLVAASRPQVIEHKARGQSAASQVVTDIDRRSEARLLEALAASTKRFDLGVLTEERDDDLQRMDKEFFWCIDPLDGTLPYVEGSPGFAVSIALVSRAGLPMIGVVYDPERDALYCAIRGLGIVLNNEPWCSDPSPTSKTLSVFADRSIRTRPGLAHVVPQLHDLALAMGLETMNLHLGAGAVINACRTLTSAPACYFKAPRDAEGGGSLWDFAATACLFAEAGAVATDLFGHPLDLNRADSTFMNHRGVLFATSAALAREITSRFAP